MNDSLPTDASKTDGFASDPLHRFRADREDCVEPDLFTLVACRRGAVSDRDLAVLVKLDLDRRWRSGRSCLIDAYFLASPRPAESSALGRELMAAEYLARSTCHTPPPDSELAVRFPELVDALPRAAQAARFRESCEATGRFFLVQRVGAGGMGEVFAAIDRKRQGLVALKTLPTAHPELLYKFKHEFRALEKVVHSNLVPLYELVSRGDKWFFTMELIDGRADGECHVFPSGSETVMSVREAAVGQFHTGPRVPEFRNFLPDMG